MSNISNEQIFQAIIELASDVTTMKTDIVTIKSDIVSINEEQKLMRNDITTIQKFVKEIKETVAKLEIRIGFQYEDLQKTRADVVYLN